MIPKENKAPGTQQTHRMTYKIAGQGHEGCYSPPIHGFRRGPSLSSTCFVGINLGTASVALCVRQFGRFHLTMDQVFTEAYTST